MNEHVESLPTSVSMALIQAKIKSSDYILLPDGRTTICQLTLENGFTVRGESSCVDATRYNQALGEKYAYENAIDKIWPLEGYLLTQRRFEAGLK